MQTQAARAPDDRRTLQRATADRRRIEFVATQVSGVYVNSVVNQTVRLIAVWPAKLTPSIVAAGVQA